MCCHGNHFTWLPTITSPDCLQSLHLIAFNHFTWLPTITSPDCLQSLHLIAYNHFTWLPTITSPDCLQSLHLIATIWFLLDHSWAHATATTKTWLHTTWFLLDNLITCQNNHQNLYAYRNRTCRMMHANSPILQCGSMLSFSSTHMPHLV